jgi:Cys-tRNA(Pro) deacylase
MAREKTPVTQAVRELRSAGISFTDHLYSYEEKGGTQVSSRELGVDEHCVIKTLVMEDDLKNPLLVLMHGDLQVSTKELARQIGARAVEPCRPDMAQKHTGYLTGGTSPFGTRRKMPVYIEQTILGLPKIHINGGKRGYLVGMVPADLMKLLQAVVVNVGISK